MKGISIQRLKKEDVITAQKLILLLQDVFEENTLSIPSTTYLKKLLDDSRFILYTILQKDKVIGGLTAYELPSYYDEYAEVYVYDIAIKKDMQRKGLGKKLLDTLLEDCSKQEIKDVFVDADKEDQHALDFYHATGGKSAEVIQFTYTTNN